MNLDIKYRNDRYPLLHETEANFGVPPERVIFATCS